MPNAHPASEAVQLYNDLLDLPFSAKDEAVRIEFRLRQQTRRDPRAVDARVALAQAYQMAAKPSEAIEEVRDLYGLIYLMDEQVFHSYLLLAKELGVWEIAGEFAHLSADRAVGRKVSLSQITNVVDIALGSGDADLLDKVSNFENVSWHTAPSIKKIIEETIGLNHLSGHMAIVNDVLAGKYVGFDVGYAPSVENPTEFAFLYHVDASRTERDQLEDQIDQALQGFYRQHGYADLMPFVHRFTFNVLPHEAAAHRVHEAH